jgi:glycosyltransferase involved in cell wall biosynthesis
MHTESTPKVSVIMVTYNRAAFILQTIESIRQQTYNDWELIIVDDGSEDNTEDIILGLNDMRINFYKAGRTGIGGHLKNIGLTKANGQLIAFIDSDDLWDSRKLEKQIKALSQYQEAGFCMTGGYNFRSLGQPLEYFYENRDGAKCYNIFLSIFKSEIAGFTQALMLHKKCLDKAGYFKESKSFSDVDFIIQLARHFKAVILYEPLVFRRLHNTNWIDSNWIKSNYEGIELIHQYEGELPKNVVREALFRIFINFGENYLKRREQRKAIGKFLTAWKYKPMNIVPTKKIIKALIYRFLAEPQKQ